MKNSLFRKAAVGTFAAAAAVGLSTLFATPASAHSAGPAGKADCGVNGTYTVTWTVSNDYNKTVDLTNIKINETGETHAAISLAEKGKSGSSSSFTTTYAGTTSKSLTLSVDARWSDGYTKSFTSRPVQLKGDCKTTEHTPSPSPSKSPSKSPSPTPETSKSVTPPPPSVSPSPSLPVTGSSSTLPMVGTGAALIAGGAGLVFAIRRRRNVTFTAE
ncbi:LPXTG cell wall anchor domain-containing protein [Dactylosporangium sp. CA-052675]|uniref:LPXTG cell wall anchor domain-containing protein n=1 Tax=Dactylosporangium sp. CA-052675 TaxID=3239927 RepID=UPI003D8F90B7